MKLAITIAAMSMLALPAFADDTDARPPVDRAAALLRAPQFKDHIEAALTAKPDDLYRAALTGTASDQWIWGLALTVERYDTDSVPPAQLRTFQDYDKKVEAAKDAWSRKHKHDAMPDKSMAEWVTPTPEEAQAVLIVQSINTPDLWLNKARGSLDGAVIDQSVQCLSAIEQEVEAQDLMQQLLGSIGTVTSSSKDSGSSSSSSSDDDEDLAALLSGDKDDEDLDNDALCGGADAFRHDKALLKAIYKSKITVSVGKS